jgi:integrase
VFLVFGTFAGFRVSEIINFNIEHVLDDGTEIDLLIQGGTRKKKGRTIWIWKAAGHFVRTLLLARLSQGAKTGDPLLVSYKKNGEPRGNRRLTQKSCDNLLKTLARRAGVRKNPIKTHMLRATHANDLQRIRGYAMPQIMERLGWKHLITVERYLVRRERIHKTYNNLHEYWIEFTRIWIKIAEPMEGEQ